MSGGGSSVDLDVITATAEDILAGKTGVDQEGEPVAGTLALSGNAGVGDVLNGKTFYTTNPKTKQTGTLTLSGNAQAVHVLNGETFYTTDPKSKQTGSMTVNSLLSFSVAVNSGRRVTATWKNPIQAAGKPYSGVYIKYSISGNPGTGGTQIYKGVGSNTASGGTSTVTFNLPNLNTKYYLSIYPYVTTSAGEMLGGVLNAQVTTGGTQTQTITSSKSVTVPQGYTLMDVFCVGGGGKGHNGIGSDGDYYGGGAGGGGYTKTVTDIPISAEQKLAVIVGAGATSISSNGGASSVTRNGTTLASAAGGYSANPTGVINTGGAGNGGSGGGSGGNDTGSSDARAGYAGGSDGGNGSGHSSSVSGKGQGTTTKAWGSSSGTLYSGGGGGGGAGNRQGATSTGKGASGGSGGGGAGGNGGTDGSKPATNGANGSANTGGGGGGGGGGYSGHATGGNGGSGIVLIRFH